MSEVLAVFARAPRLGQVKTRLSPPLTPEQCLELHRALVEDTLEQLRRVRRPELEKMLLLSEPLEEGETLRVPDDFAQAIQSGGSLGERLASLFYTSFRRGVSRVVVLGSDSPTLPMDVVHDAFDHLENGKVIVGPAEDGGYYLIGSSEWIPEMFQSIDWGSSRVLEQTVESLTAKNLDVDRLVSWYDVDRPEDLEKLREEIAYLKRAAPELVPVRVAAVVSDGSEPEYTVDRDF